MTRAVRPNIGIELRYKKQLCKLIDEMHNSVMCWVKAGYKEELKEIMALDETTPITR